MDNAKQYTIKQTRGKTVKFLGTCIAEAGGKWRNGVEANRWTELTLYKTASGKYILVNEWNTYWQGESNSTTVHICQTPAEVVANLEGEDGELGTLDTELLQDALKSDPAFEAVAVDTIE